MSGDRDLIELMDADPAVFGDAGRRAAHERRPGPTDVPVRWRFALAFVVGLTLGAVGTIAWSHGRRSTLLPPATTLAPPVTTLVTPSTGNEPVTTTDGLPGFAAAPETVGAGISLDVEPSIVTMGVFVNVQLHGDLSRVASPLRADAVIDELLFGEWRTIEWFTGSEIDSAGRFSSLEVSSPTDIRSDQAPLVGADRPVYFVFDQLGTGIYRLCRTLPQAIDPSDTTVRPRADVRVCAPLAVDHLGHP